MAKEALQFVDKNKDKRFFLYLALTIPHANNEARGKGMEVPDHGIYKDKDWPEPQKGHAAMITRMDSDIGELMARLKKHGIDEKTIVLFTSDNGPHAEGGNDPKFNDSNGPLRGLKRDLTEGGIRVPLIVRWPKHVKPGTTSDHIGCFQDLMPTLAQLAGVSKEVPENIDGISFAPSFLNEGVQKKHDYLYWAFYERGGAKAVRQGKWKLIQQPLRTKPRLYNLDADLGESKNIAKEHPEVVKELTAKMEKAYTPSPRWKFPAGRKRKK